MAFKLSKAKQKRIEAFRDKLTALRESVVAEAAKYNEELEEARQFVTEIAGDMSEAMTERNERWQQSDRGTATESWIEELENIELIEIEIEDDDENVTILEELPLEPDS